MKEKKEMTLNQMYAAVCNKYLEAFVRKHGFDPSDCGWGSNAPGTIATLGDYFADMQTIITDIDRDAPEEEWLRWYDYSLDCNDIGLTACNYDSWLRGCPRHSEESLSRLRQLQQGVMKAKMLLLQAVDEENERLG